MDNNLVVSSSPHAKSARTTQNIMLDVIIALVPVEIFSVILFGWRTLLIIGLSVASALLSEALCCKIMKRPVAIKDLSAVLTGILLAFNLPPTAPWWLPVLGSAIAIIVVKQFFGGIGHNFANPAITARIVLFVSFPKLMTTWANPAIINLKTTATPLEILKGTAQGDVPRLLHLFIGFKGGCIGETSVLLLILGGLYLVIRKVIKPIIPVCYIGTVAILTFIFTRDFYTTLQYLLSGGLFLGAIFMATDYVTSPITNKGKVIFGIGCGILTTVMRFFCSSAEGVSYSILIMNIITPHIDALTLPKPFGEEKGAKVNG